MQRTRPGTAFLQREVEATKSKIKTGQIIQTTVSSAVASSIVITILHFSCFGCTLSNVWHVWLEDLIFKSNFDLVWFENLIQDLYGLMNLHGGKQVWNFWRTRRGQVMAAISLSRICAEMESAVFVQKKQKTICFPICPKKHEISLCKQV